MLTAINKIKGLGVFGDFAAAVDLPPFKRFNLIYGENGSGKTTLSRLFTALQTGAHADYPDLDYSITTDAGTLAKGQPSPRKIRVFNSDYIEANIGQFNGPLKHILIVGQENKELAEEIKAEQAAHDDRKAKLDVETVALTKLETDKGKAFSAIAKTIGEATSGTTLRGYRKPDAEAAYKKLTTPKTYSEAELDIHRVTIRQEQAEAVPQISQPKVKAKSGAGIDIQIALSTLVTATGILTQRASQVDALSRLVEKPDISLWVETGLEIHRTHESKDCEFCGQKLPEERLKRLSEHFSTADQQLKTEIEAEIKTAHDINAAISSVQIPPKAGLFSEIREDFEATAQEFETARTSALTAVSKVAEILSKKLTERSKPYAIEIAVDTTALFQSLDKVRALIDRHNAKSADFEAQKKAARHAIETHYLSSIAPQVREFDEKIDATQNTIKKLRDGAADLGDARSLDELLKSISEKKAKVSSAHAGGAQMTSKLNAFLGRTDLTFDSGDDGYRLKRRGKPARRLSEGEKTAIAFLYFIVQLGDQDFDIKEGIVVIDDPISSLDAAAIFQAFSYLKNAVKEAKQVFLFTHNFDFLKLLLNWLDHGAKQNQRSYLMIVCTEAAAGRSSHLMKLDQLLVEHPTEYHYLFKLLYTFESDGTIQSSYNIPNIARKLLETFLEFHVPSNENLYKKLDKLKFDDNKKTAIYKFTNDLSHMTGKGFDPALVAETQKNTTYLLEMIKAVAPDHYDGLERLAKGASAL
ncbi:AAA family ATPase [Ferrovibrio sp. MS7]|uniref:AAA family ATPase n=1 Tax=Ferrovibrio plantarum TaxID=3119164 RepID=UPI00313598C1